MYIIRKININKNKFNEVLSYNKNNYNSSDFLKFFSNSKKSEISLYCTKEEHNIRNIITAISIGGEKLIESYAITIQINDADFEQLKNSNRIDFGESIGDTSWAEINNYHYHVKSNSEGLGFFCDQFMENYKLMGEFFTVKDSEILLIFNKNINKIEIEGLKPSIKKSLIPNN